MNAIAGVEVETVPNDVAVGIPIDDAAGWIAVTRWEER